jgi:urease accessory protein
MIIYREIIGNIAQSEWHSKLQNVAVTILELDQWNAQKSRMVIEKDGEQYAILLQRKNRLNNGDILNYNENEKRATIVKVNLTDVMVINLKKIAKLGSDKLIQSCIELGHALGNQHWPAVVKDDKVYVPLTLDKKVMESVMQTHNFPNIEYTFQKGEEVIPFLAPHDIRYLFSGGNKEHYHV